MWEQFDKDLGGTEMKPGDDQHLLDTNYITQLLSSVSFPDSAGVVFFFFGGRGGEGKRKSLSRKMKDQVMVMVFISEGREVAVARTIWLNKLPTDGQSIEGPSTNQTIVHQ